MSQQPPFPPPGGNPYGPAGHDHPGSYQEFPPPAPQTDPYGGSPSGNSTAQPAGQLPPPPPPRRRRSGWVFAAAIVAAALVVGGGAGIGGSALYDAASGSGGSEAPVTTSPVVTSSDDDPAAKGSVEQVAQKVLPSVVKLNVSGPQGSGSGSGVVLSSDGVILTNNHVVEVAEDDGRIIVSFNDGSNAPARILGTDPLTDTAVIKAEGVEGLTPAAIGASGEVDVGEKVVAIGSPFGLASTVTSGIVSALDRPVSVGSDARGNATVYPAIQTDAAINPGNSGGPLVDMQGRVIGINSSIRSAGGPGAAGSIGLGFAIPIDEVLPIIEQMKNGETPTHARLGVTVRDVGATAGTAPGGAPSARVLDGARVVNVPQGTAASEAGLQSGDVITGVEDDLITGADSLVATIRSYRPGDEVTLTYERDGEEETTTLTLGSDAETSDS